MTSPYELFGTDKNLEAQQGVELDYGDFSITVHRAGGGNHKFRTVFSQKMKPYQRRFDNGTLDDETAQQILIEAYAEAVIKDWHGVTDAEGNKLDCTVENIVKLFTDLPDLFSDVQEQAQNVANFRQDNKEAASKNSKTS